MERDHHVNERSDRYSAVDLRLLGSFKASRGDADLTAALSQARRLALLTWLVLHRPPGRHRRDVLCALLWPESSDQKARGSLRQLLLVLRRELGETAVVVEGDLVSIDPTLLQSDAGAV